MKLEEAIKQLKDLKKDMKKDTKGSEGIFKQDVQAIETVLKHIEHLQKENEELKNIDLTTVHIKGVCDEKERWRNKIKKQIEVWEPELEKTDKKLEEAQTQEERVVLKCIGIRLDERIKTLQDLLKEE